MSPNIKEIYKNIFFNDSALTKDTELTQMMIYCI